MKTIMFISNVSGGLYRFRGELIQLLVKEHRVIILASDSGFVQEFRDMGCEFVETKLDRHGTNPLTEWKTIGMYKRLIREKKPDVVLTYTIKQNIYAGMACASLGVPYIANITGLGPAVENAGRTQKIMLILYRFGLRKAKMVFFQNKTNERFLLDNGVVKGPHMLLPGSGVNLDRYQVLPWPEGDTVEFTFIARIVKEKGIDQYLEAAKIIRQRHPETRFHVCGSCDESYNAILKQADAEGTIIYHGKVKDVTAIHRLSSCTVHPSYYPEGMSNVLLESCASGRPIITTDRPGCGEIVEEGVNGFLVRKKDADDLVEKLERFLALSPQQRKQMGLAGRAKVEKEFDRQIVIRRYLEAMDLV